MGERGTFKRIGIAQAEEILKRPGVVILDVRDVQSYHKGISSRRRTSPPAISATLSAAPGRPRRS